MNKKEFIKSMSEWHCNKPYLNIHFEDNFSDELKDKWIKLDKAILEVIWQIPRENDIDTTGEMIK